MHQTDAENVKKAKKVSFCRLSCNYWTIAERFHKVKSVLLRFAPKAL